MVGRRHQRVWAIKEALSSEYVLPETRQVHCVSSKISEGAVKPAPRECLCALRGQRSASTIASYRFQPRRPALISEPCAQELSRDFISLPLLKRGTALLPTET